MYTKADLSAKVTYSLSENYFNSENYEANKGKGMERILQGLVTQRSQKCDNHVSSETTNKLFPGAGKSFGGDLVARYYYNSIITL